MYMFIFGCKVICSYMRRAELQYHIHDEASSVIPLLEISNVTWVQMTVLYPKSFKIQLRIELLGSNWGESKQNFQIFHYFHLKLPLQSSQKLLKASRFQIIQWNSVSALKPETSWDAHVWWQVLQRSSCGIWVGFKCVSQHTRLLNVKQKSTGTEYGDSLHRGKSRYLKKKSYSIHCFICHEGSIMKPVLLIKKTAVQNERDLERQVILKGTLELEQPWESWDTQAMYGCGKWKLNVSGTMIWRSRKDCSTVQTQMCDMRLSHCVMESGSKAGHFVKSLEVLKYSCQKKKKSFTMEGFKVTTKGKQYSELFRTKRLFLSLRDIKKFTDRIDAGCSVFPKD